MTSTLRRALVVVSLFVLLASACSSSSGETDAFGAASDTADLTDEPDPSDSDGGDPVVEETDPVATSIPVPEDDGAADAAIAGLDADTEPTPEIANADRSTTATDFVRNRFNIDPDPDWVKCVVGQATNDDTLDLALQTPSVGRGDVDDVQLKSLTYAMSGCIDALSLGDWATQAVGPRGDVLEAAPACFADRFSDANTGEATFYGFTALTFQFRIDPAGVPDLLDALVTCSPINGLTEFFASQHESASGFTVNVDRTCLDESLAEPEVSEAFWSTFIDGLQPPVTFTTPYLESCETAIEDPNADLAQSLPSDFEPWAGTGALAAVAPIARQNAYSSPPPMSIDPSRNYEAVFATNGGEVRIQLFADTAPITVNNFVSLARDGYFDGTVFHRVLQNFMAQGGDPTGTGTGGPGYSFQDEFESDRVFDKPGILAMANSGPGTNGSQFFITTVVTDWLTGGHTIFGEVTQGYDLVEAIELRDPGAPSGRGQVLDSVTIIES